MSTIADAEIIAALSARCALLTASLKQAEDALSKREGDIPAALAGTFDIDKLAQALAERIIPKVSVPLESQLWDAGQIASYLGMSKSQVTQRFLPLTDFPRAIRIPTADGHRSNARWKAAEIIEWAERHQDRKRRAV